MTQQAEQMARILAGTVIMAAMIARGDALETVAKEAANLTDALIGELEGGDKHGFSRDMGDDIPFA